MRPVSRGSAVRAGMRPSPMQDPRGLSLPLLRGQRPLAPLQVVNGEMRQTMSLGSSRSAQGSWDEVGGGEVRQSLTMGSTRSAIGSRDEAPDSAPPKEPSTPARRSLRAAAAIVTGEGFSWSPSGALGSSDSVGGEEETSGARLQHKGSSGLLLSPLILRGSRAAGAAAAVAEAVAAVAEALSPSRVVREAISPSRAMREVQAKARRASETFSLIRSKSSLERKLFELADRECRGLVSFCDFAWLHWNLLRRGGQPRVSTLEQIGGCYPHEVFRRFDADRNLSLDQEEWRSYTDGLASVLGPQNLQEACRSILREREQGESVGKYNDQASRQLLEKIHCAQHLGKHHAEQIQVLLDKGADPNYVDFDGNSLLSKAAEKCDTSLMGRLLEHGGSASLGGARIDSASFAAARARNLEVLHLLLIGRRNVTADQQLAEDLSAKLADRMSELAVKDIRELVHRGADVNYRNSQGWTPLTAAVFWGRRESVECLVRLPTLSSKIRLQVDLRDTRGRTALHVAARKGEAELIPLLVSAKADVDAKDSAGWTPLHHAVFNSHSAAVVALVGANANILLQDHNRVTPYMLTDSPLRTSSSLTKEALAALQPPEPVNFLKQVLPILKDSALEAFDKLEALLSLQGVQGRIENLRFYDQAFNLRRGPNRLQTGKFWELLGRELLTCLRSERTGVANHFNDPAEREQHKQRLRMQKQFVAAWLAESAGPPQSSDWEWDSREGYRDALADCITQELEGFRHKCHEVYSRVLEQPGGSSLRSMPYEEILLPEYLSQLGSHPPLPWLAAADAVGAFEALRDIKAVSTGCDCGDREALTEFMDLVAGEVDFSTGPAFWQNAYKLWLSHYARALNSDFQAKLKRFATTFNEEHYKAGLQVSFYGVPPKSFEQMKAHEDRVGKPGHQTLEERTVATKMLDIVRCSMTANSPDAVVALVEAFRLAANQGGKWGRLELARVQNGFHQCANPVYGVRMVTLNIVFHAGDRNVLRTGGNLQLRAVGEVRVLLPEFLAIQKSLHPLARHLEKEAELEVAGRRPQ